MNHLVRSRVNSYRTSAMDAASCPPVLAADSTDAGNKDTKSSPKELATKIDCSDTTHRDTLRLLFQLHCVPVKASGTPADFPGRTGAPVPGCGYALCEVCKEPEGAKQTLLCDVCHRSYHIACINIQAEQACKLDEWFCKSCSSQGANQMWRLGKVDLNLRLRRSQTHHPESPEAGRISEEEKAPTKILGEDVSKMGAGDLNGRRGSQADNNSSRPRVASQPFPNGPHSNSVDSSEYSQTQKRPRQENVIQDISFTLQEAGETRMCLVSDISEAGGSNDSNDRPSECEDRDLMKLGSYVASNRMAVEDGRAAHSKAIVTDGDETTTTTRYYSPPKKLFQSRRQVARHLGLIQTGDDGGTRSTCETESKFLDCKSDTTGAPMQDDARTSPLKTPDTAGTSLDCSAKPKSGGYEPPAPVESKAESCLSKSRHVKTPRARGNGLASKCTAGEIEQLERFRRLEIAAVEQLQKYVADRSGVLEDGWKADVTKRKKGKGSTVRTHYVSPEGRVFKSRVQVADYLGLLKENGHQGGAAGSAPCTKPSDDTVEGVANVSPVGATKLQTLPAVDAAPTPAQVSDGQRLRSSQMLTTETRHAQQVAMQVTTPLALGTDPAEEQALQTAARSGRGPMQLLRQYISEMNGDLGDGWSAEVSTRKKYGKVAKETKYFSPENKIFRSRVQIARHLGLLDTTKGRGSGVCGKESKEPLSVKAHNSPIKIADKGEPFQSTTVDEARCDEVIGSTCDILTEDDILRNIREFVAEQNILLKEQLKQDTDIDSFVRRKRPRVRLCLDIARQLGAAGLKSLDI